MATIEIEQALPQMKQLLEQAAMGEEVVITQNHLPIVKLVPVPVSQSLASVVEGDTPAESLRDRHSLVNLVSPQPHDGDRLTPEERVNNWLNFVQSLPANPRSLPEEALHRDSMYD